MDQLSLPQALSHESLQEGVACLAKVDDALAGVLEALGNPPLWPRQPGFPTLVHIILEQQVSLASARAAFVKLNEAVGDLTPESTLTLNDVKLREIGFSWQKREYCRELSKAVLRGDLDLAALETMDDRTARAELMKVKGIGPWTADIYLLMALQRPDVWPSGDLAIAKAVQAIKELPSLPTPAELEEIAEPWKPWRAVAARVLWHHYLS